MLAYLHKAINEQRNGGNNLSRLVIIIIIMGHGYLQCTM
jgi:hypothetical protein